MTEQSENGEPTSTRETPDIFSLPYSSRLGDSLLVSFRIGPRVRTSHTVSPRDTEKRLTNDYRCGIPPPGAEASLTQIARRSGCKFPDRCT